MDLPSYVLKKPFYFAWLPWFSGPACTIYPYIYMPKGVYKELVSATPAASALATLAHEQVHWQRQKDMGIVRYGLRYVFGRQFRYQEELLAIRAQIKVLKEHGLDFDMQDRARRLSGAEYAWCVSFSRAMVDLTHIEQDL